MITRALVEQIIDNYSVKVRIPFFNRAANAHGATPTENLNTARICVNPSILPRLKVGDAVFVGFEDNDDGRPVILGLLFSQNSKSVESDSLLQQLSVVQQAQLPKQTRIGDVTPVEIEYLSGVKDNIQKQINQCSVYKEMFKERVESEDSAPSQDGMYYGYQVCTYTVDNGVETFCHVFIWTPFGWKILV